MEADNLFRVPGPHQHPNSPSRRQRWGITRRQVRRAKMARPTLLAGALPPSLRDLRPSLTVLDLYTSGIASVPTEIAPLTGLQDLTLAFNLNGLTGFFNGDSPSDSGPSTRRATAPCPGTWATTRTRTASAAPKSGLAPPAAPLTNAVHRDATPGDVFSSFGGKNLAADQAQLVSATKSPNSLFTQNKPRKQASQPANHRRPQPCCRPVQIKTPTCRPGPTLPRTNFAWS